MLLNHWNLLDKIESNSSKAFPIIIKKCQDNYSSPQWTKIAISLLFNLKLFDIKDIVFATYSKKIQISQLPTVRLMDKVRNDVRDRHVVLREMHMSYSTGCTSHTTTCPIRHLDFSTANGSAIVCPHDPACLQHHL